MYFKSTAHSKLRRNMTDASNSKRELLVPSKRELSSQIKDLQSWHKFVLARGQCLNLIPAVMREYMSILKGDHKLNSQKITPWMDRHRFQPWQETKLQYSVNSFGRPPTEFHQIVAVKGELKRVANTVIDRLMEDSQNVLIVNERWPHKRMAVNTRFYCNLMRWEIEHGTSSVRSAGNFTLWLETVA